MLASLTTTLSAIPPCSEREQASAVANVPVADASDARFVRIRAMPTWPWAAGRPLEVAGDGGAFVMEELNSAAWCDGVAIGPDTIVRQGDAFYRFDPRPVRRRASDSRRCWQARPRSVAGDARGVPVPSHDLTSMRSEARGSK